MHILNTFNYKQMNQFKTFFQGRKSNLKKKLNCQFNLKKIWQKQDLIDFDFVYHVKKKTKQKFVCSKSIENQCKYIIR